MIRRKNGIASLTGEVADDITDMNRVNFLLYHEVMHVLTTEGFFKHHEFVALKEAATDQWIDRYGIRERYPENDKAVQDLIKQQGITYEQLVIEEAISEAFADYMTGRLLMKGPIARAFEKLKQYLTALGNALTANRFNSAESVFNQVDLGIVGERFKTLERSNVVYDGGINGAKIVVTDRNWSGSGALDGYNLIQRKRSFLFGSRQDKKINTKEFFNWFNKGGRESIVTTKNGAPLVVMHTTTTNRDGVPFEEEVIYPSNLWDYPIQRIESGRTSINVTKLPTGHTIIINKKLLESGTINLDLGGWRADNATEALQTIGVTNHVWDPFNRSETHNRLVAKNLSNGKTDSVTIHNVFNVIEENENIDKLLLQAHNALKPNGKLFISVYPKDRTGVGAPTMKGESYQRNEKIEQYLNRVKKLFPNAKLSNGMIIASKNLKKGAPFNAFNMEMSQDLGMHFTATQRHVDYIQQHNPANIDQKYYTFKGFLQLSNPYRMPDLNLWHPRDILAFLARDGIFTAKQLENS